MAILRTNFKIGIFGKTKERALQAFDAVVEGIEYEKIKYVRRSSISAQCAECVLFDGTTIIALVAIPHLAQKFDRIFYDDEIYWNDVDCLVRPCLATPIWSFRSVGLELQ